ncbi:MAG: putative colanic acid biosynthesis acetyltransferase [Verrucomicrobiota bacterium]
MPRPDESPFEVDLSRCTNDWDARTKLRRGIWQCLVRPLYLLIPGRLAAPRIAILRMFGAKIGRHCNIQARVSILIPWHLEMGDYVALARGVEVLNFAPVRIGSMTVVSQRAHLCTGTHDVGHPHFQLVSKPIRIEPESWVASGAFVGPGVTLGRGCVIGAHAVVTKDMPAWKVCAGNPCRPLKDRHIRSEHAPSEQPS